MSVPAPQFERLLDLARSKMGDDRRRLVLAVADLCELAARAAPATSARADELLSLLLRQAEFEIRQALAERLADAAWAPVEMVRLLARDEIAIAQPIIDRSPLLKDPDLLALLQETTLDHQIAVAGRRDLSEPVAHAIVAAAEPTVMAALADNPTAAIAPSDLSRLVDHARCVAGLRAPLARHPRMTPALGVRLYALVSDALREALCARFALPREDLDEALQEAAAQARLQFSNGPAAPDDDAIDRERRLIEKLHQGDQLRPGYLMRALGEGRLTLFQLALAKLSGLSPSAIEAACQAEQSLDLAIACRRAGIDRCVFTTVLNRIRALARGRPLGEAWTEAFKAAAAG